MKIIIIIALLKKKEYSRILNQNTRKLPELQYLGSLKIQEVERCGTPVTVRKRSYRCYHCIKISFCVEFYLQHKWELTQNSMVAILNEFI